MASGVDLVVVNVRSVTKSGNFTNTIVTDGAIEYSVVTNLSGVGMDSHLAVAFLPPREIGGTLSEAIFLGEENRPEPAGTVLAEEDADTREAAGILYDEISKSH